jgi:ABC-type nitrate/sulfonate/bicarbonate transport systems, periplasmic components
MSENNTAPRSFTRRKVVKGSVLAFAVTMGLVLSGCAPGDNGARGDSSDSKPLAKVSIGYSSPGASYSDLYIGQSEGVFKKNGLDVTLRTLNSSSQVIPAILSNSVDIAIGSATESAAAIMKGSELTVIAITRPVFNLEVYVDPKVKTIADLKGKKIGLTSPGSQSDQALTAWLEKNGMKREDVEPTYVKSIPGQLAALQSGSVSAILSQPPQTKQVLDAGFTVLAQLTDIPFPSAAVVVTNQFLKDHADIVDAFVKSEVENLKLLQSDEAAAIKAIQQYSGVADKVAAKYAYDFFKGVWGTDLTPKTALVKQAFDLAAIAVSEPAPADVTKFINSSFAEKYVGK